MLDDAKALFNKWVRHIEAREFFDAQVTRRELMTMMEGAETSLILSQLVHQIRAEMVRHIREGVE